MMFPSRFYCETRIFWFYRLLPIFLVIMISIYTKKRRKKNYFSHLI